MKPDPVFVHARRELWVILGAWALLMCWSIGYSAFAGYEVPEGPVPTVLGMPRWIFFAVFLPWVLASLFTVVFSLRVMKADDLGREEPPDGA